MRPFGQLHRPADVIQAIRRWQPIVLGGVLHETSHAVAGAVIKVGGQLQVDLRLLDTEKSAVLSQTSKIWIWSSLPNAQW